MFVLFCFFVRCVFVCLFLVFFCCFVVFVGFVLFCFDFCYDFVFFVVMLLFFFVFFFGGGVWRRGWGVIKQRYLTTLYIFLNTICLNI